VAIVLKSESLKLLKPYRPVQTCNGINLLCAKTKQRKHPSTSTANPYKPYCFILPDTYSRIPMSWPKFNRFSVPSAIRIHHLTSTTVTRCDNFETTLLKIRTNLFVENVNYFSLMFIPCIIRHIRNYQQCVLICNTPLLYVPAPTCFGSSMPSLGSIWDRSELLENQIEWVMYNVWLCDLCAHRSHKNTLHVYITHQIWFSSNSGRISNAPWCYCRNM
jgi:hypothetical protein